MTRSADEPCNLARLFADRVRRCGDQTALWYRCGAAWRSLSWRRWWDLAGRAAASLCAKGIEPGDRVAIVGRLSPRWLVAELGIIRAAAVVVPIATDLGDDHVRWAARTGECKLAILTDEIDVGLTGLVPEAFELFDIEPGLASFDTSVNEALERRDRALLELGGSAPWRRSFTDGLTEERAAVELCHEDAVRMARTVSGAFRHEPESGHHLLAVCPSHIFAAGVVWGALAGGWPVALVPSEVELREALFEMAPQCAHLSTRACRQLHSVLVDRLISIEPILRPAVNFGLQSAADLSRLREWGHDVAPTVVARRLVIDGLLLRKVRSQLGSQLRYLVCAGDLLQREVADFFNACGAIPLGVSVNAAARGFIACNRPERYRLATAGPLVSNLEIRLADDGELFVRRLDGSAPASEGGWISTGELARMQDDGVLVPLGPKASERIGARARPIRQIERRIERHLGVQSACIIRKDGSWAALIELDAVALRQLTHGRPLDYEEIAPRPAIARHIAKVLQCANADAPLDEHIDRFAIVGRPLAADTGELTELGQVRRHVVANRFAGAEFHEVGR